MWSNSSARRSKCSWSSWCCIVVREGRRSLLTRWYTGDHDAIDILHCCSWASHTCHACRTRFCQLTHRSVEATQWIGTDGEMDTQVTNLSSGSISFLVLALAYALLFVQRRSLLAGDWGSRATVSTRKKRSVSHVVPFPQVRAVSPLLRIAPRRLSYLVAQASSW